MIIIIVAITIKVKINYYRMTIILRIKVSNTPFSMKLSSIDIRH